MDWANKAGDITKIQYIYSDDNSKELMGRLSIKQSFDVADSHTYNGLVDQSDIISSLKMISDELLEKLVIKGVKHIRNIVMNNTPYTTFDEGEIIQEKRWILETDGTNLLDVLNEPYINYTLTHSNDINETYQLLGTEAARALLIQQIIEVIEEGAGYLNSRHVDLLCDAQ